MNKAIRTGPAIEGRTVTEHGEQYFVMDKIRIKITEHFRPDGRPIEELITALVENKIKENTGKHE